MNIRFLASFVLVAKLKSFRLAAERLNTTQAAISSRIATLEDYFGARLFERDSRSVSLTAQGLQLLPYAERMLELNASMMAAMGVEQVLAGVLRIGVIETIVHTWLPELLKRFAEEHPQVTIEFESADTPTLHERLLKGALDCVITSEDVATGFIENNQLARLRMVWVAHATIAGTLAGRRNSFAEIARYPIISFHRTSPVYRGIAQMAAGGDLRISYFSSLGAMTGLVRAGVGIALLPLAVVAADVQSGSLALVDAEPAPNALPLIASLRSDSGSPLADVLLTLARSTCADYFAARPALLAE